MFEKGVDTKGTLNNNYPKVEYSRTIYLMGET